MAIGSTFTLLALIAFLPSASLAQDNPNDTLRLSLPDVLAQVRVEHPIWQAGSSKIVAAEARAAQSRRSPNPKLTVEPAALPEVKVELVQPIRWPWEAAALKGVGRTDVAAAAAEAEAERRRDARRGSAFRRRAPQHSGAAARHRGGEPGATHGGPSPGRA